MARFSRSHFLVRVALVSALLLAASCAPTPPSTSPPPSTPPPKPIRAERAKKADNDEPSLGPLLDAYRAGVAEALREIKADQMTLSTAGIIRATTRDASGLPVNTVETDALDGQTLIRIMGHNDTVRMWKNLPLNPAP